MEVNSLYVFLLKVQTDNPKAADELEKREFQVKNIVIQELSEMTPQDLEGKAGKQAFEEALNRILIRLCNMAKCKRCISCPTLFSNYVSRR